MINEIKFDITSKLKLNVKLADGNKNPQQEFSGLKNGLVSNFLGQRQKTLKDSVYFIHPSTYILRQLKI